MGHLAKFAIFVQRDRECWLVEELSHLITQTLTLGSAPPRRPVDRGGGGDLARVVSRPEGFVIENLLIYVVSILIVLDSVGVGVELCLHHHGGGDHLAGKYNQLIEMPSTVK